MRLIDADAIMNTLQKLFDEREKEQMFTGSREPCVTWNDAICHIKSAPTVDAVQVVRCKDCKFWHEVDTMNVLRYGECDRLCSAIRQDCFVNENWFCADGEEKHE